MYFLDWCSDLGPVIKLLKSVVTLLKWGIPMVLIIMGMMDLGKAVIASKEDDMKKAQSVLIKRLIYAVAVFLVITIVTFAIGLVSSKEWKNCWDSTQTITGTPNVTDVE